MTQNSTKMSSRMKKSMKAMTKNEMMSQSFFACKANLNRNSICEKRIKGSKFNDFHESKQSSHQTYRWQWMIRQRIFLSRAATEIFRKIDRHFVFNDDKFSGVSVVTIHGLRMTKAINNISIVIKNLNRCERHKTIYQTLNVAEQKDFPFDENFLKNRASWFVKNSNVYAAEWAGLGRNGSF